MASGNTYITGDCTNGYSLYFEGKCDSYTSNPINAAVSFQYKSPSDTTWHTIHDFNDENQHSLTFDISPTMHGTHYTRVKVVENASTEYYYPSSSGYSLNVDTGLSLSLFQILEDDYSTILADGITNPNQRIYTCPGTNLVFKAQTNGNSLKMQIGPDMINIDYEGNILTNKHMTLNDYNYACSVTAYTRSDFNGCYRLFDFNKLNVTTYDNTEITINSFTASPSTINNGDTSTLSVNLNRSAIITIYDDNNNIIHSVNNNNTSVNVSPSTTTTYTVYASAQCVTTKTDQCTITVNTNNDSSYFFIT